MQRACLCIIHGLFFLILSPLLSFGDPIIQSTATVRYAKIALAIPLRRYFDYKIPKSMLPQVAASQTDVPQTSASQKVMPQIGCRVLVPFAQHKMVGVIVELAETTAIDESKIKEIETLIDQQPIFNHEMIKIQTWMVQYYLCAPGDVFINLMPKRLKQGHPATLLQEDSWQLNLSLADDAAPKFSNQAHKQSELYQFLKIQGSVTETLLRQDGFSKQTILALEKKNIIRKTATDLRPDLNIKIQDCPYPLTAEQTNAIDTINSKIGFSVALLEGVTGSGKTEVYMQLMTTALKAQKQVLILVPEIGLTPQTLKRFQARFNCEVAVLHSELNDSERHNAWLKAKLGIARIIIGTRSAVIVPAPDLGLIILDEEHDTSYKQLDGLRYNARDVAVKRAADLKCKIILGSATPALETVLNAKENRYLHLKLTQRASSIKLPTPEILDIRHQPIKAGLCYGAMEAIKHHLNNGNQVLVFLNRRGFSPALICHECGWVCICKRCDNHFTYHKSLSQVICHHCGEIDKPPKQCADCGSTQIVDVGVGTEQVFDWLNEQFPEANAIRIDRDSVSRKGELERKLNAVAAGEHQLLIGTQMLAKGHHFPDLTLTVIVNLDSALYSADFRAIERMAQILVQVAGRAGRAEKKGQVILQSHFPDHPYLQSLIQHGYPALQSQLLDERQKMRLPPYIFWAFIRLEGLQLHKVQQASEQINQLFQQNVMQHYDAVELFAAMPAPQAKRAGKYRYLIVFQSAKRSMLNAAMQQLVASLESNSFTNSVRWTIDIDPQTFN